MEQNLFPKHFITRPTGYRKKDKGRLTRTDKGDLRSLSLINSQAAVPPELTT